MDTPTKQRLEAIEARLAALEAHLKHSELNKPAAAEKHGADEPAPKRSDK